MTMHAISSCAAAGREECGRGLTEPRTGRRFIAGGEHRRQRRRRRPRAHLTLEGEAETVVEELREKRTEERRSGGGMSKAGIRRPAAGGSAQRAQRRKLSAG